MVLRGVKLALCHDAVSGLKIAGGSIVPGALLCCDGGASDSRREHRADGIGVCQLAGAGSAAACRHCDVARIAGVAAGVPGVAGTPWTD